MGPTMSSSQFFIRVSDLPDWHPLRQGWTFWAGGKEGAGPLPKLDRLWCGPSVLAWAGSNLLAADELCGRRK